MTGTLWPGEPATLGGLRDAAEPAHGVQSARCAVCGEQRPEQLRTVNAGTSGRVTEVLCLAHRAAALRRLGPPRPTDRECCVSCGAFGIVATDFTYTVAGQPVVMACRTCFTASVAALVAEHVQTEGTAAS